MRAKKRRIAVAKRLCQVGGCNGPRDGLIPALDDPAGVPAGAAWPIQAVPGTPGNPTSASVGVAASKGTRSLPVTTMAFNRAERTIGATNDDASMKNSGSPATTLSSACDPVRVGLTVELGGPDEQPLLSM